MVGTWNILREIEALEKDLKMALSTEITRLLCAGAFEIDSYKEHNIPQIVLHVALKNIADRYTPKTKDG